MQNASISVKPTELTLSVLPSWGAGNNVAWSKFTPPPPPSQYFLLPKGMPEPSEVPLPEETVHSLGSILLGNLGYWRPPLSRKTKYTSKQTTKTTTKSVLQRKLKEKLYFLLFGVLSQGFTAIKESVEVCRLLLSYLAQIVVVHACSRWQLQQHSGSCSDEFSQLWCQVEVVSDGWSQLYELTHDLQYVAVGADSLASSLIFSELSEWMESRQAWEKWFTRLWMPSSVKRHTAMSFANSKLGI